MDADAASRTTEEKTVVDSSIAGDRKTLTVDSFIPATMAVIYLLIFLYFQSTGGYRPVTVVEEQMQDAGG